MTQEPKKYQTATGVRNITISYGRFLVRFKRDGKVYRFGRFDTLRDAIKAKQIIMELKGWRQL